MAPKNVANGVDGSRTSRERVCPECKLVFETKIYNKLFCSPGCKTRFHNRSAKRGVVLTPLVLAWRAKRGSGDVAKHAFAELCRTVDAMNAEDRDAGRIPMSEFVGQGLALWHRR